MRQDGHLSESGMACLATLRGQVLRAYGSETPGVDAGVAVESVYIETGEVVLTLRTVYAPADVCGEVGDVVHLEVSNDAPDRSIAEAEGGVHVHRTGEVVRAVKIHRATLEHHLDGAESRRFEYDAAVEVVLETGSFVLVVAEIAIPLIEWMVVDHGRELELPDPAAGWPSTAHSRWTSSWTHAEVR